MLTENGLDVLVLEARDRVGGRTLTSINSQNNLWTDLGGSYVGPTQDCILRLIDEFGLETYLVDEKDSIAYLATKSPVKPRKCASCEEANNSDKQQVLKKYVASANNSNRITRRLKFFNHDPFPVGGFLSQLDMNHVVRLIDYMGRQIPSDAPWECPYAYEWDTTTVRQFIDTVAWTKNVRDFMHNVFVSVDVCCESTDASLLWFLWYVSQCGGFGRSIATTNGGQERKIKGGTQQISCKIREKLGNNRVLLNKPVYKIDQTLGPLVVVNTLDGSQYRADYVIIAVSPHLHLKMHYAPPLPPEKNLLAQRSPMGMVAKIILFYETEFWKEKGYCGSFIIQSGDHVNYPVVLGLNETKPDGSHPSIIGFITARYWFETRHLSKEEKARIVARSYAQATECEEFLTPIHVEHFDWTCEQYSGGCYTTYYPTGVLSKFGPYLRQPFGRIYYAGTETAIKWSGYMDGAVSSGERAAREILHKLGRLDESQIWRIEPPSTIIPPKEFSYSWWQLNSPSIDSLVKILSATTLVALIFVPFYLRRYSNQTFH